MKDLKGINSSSGIVDAYNLSREISPTTFFEASRWIEAVECVRHDAALFDLVRKEETDDQTRT